LVDGFYAVVVVAIAVAGRALDEVIDEDNLEGVQPRG
jgi:hypothetical protein